jgi:hypothetical protein
VRSSAERRKDNRKDSAAAVALVEELALVLADDYVLCEPLAVGASKMSASWARWKAVKSTNRGTCPALTTGSCSSNLLYVVTMRT